MKKKVLVLGGQGMLGAEVVRVLESSVDSGTIALQSTCRSTHSAHTHNSTIIRHFDAKSFVLGKPMDWEWLKDVDVVVNCIGAIKQKYKECNEVHLNNYFIANSLLPTALNDLLRYTDVQVIQIATDCVFAGTKGSYIEKDVKDAEDVYGRTKILGEVLSDRFMHLRCSIIGFEKETSYSLLSWFLAQTQSVYGFTNHYWNGITTLHFARIIRSIIVNGIFESGIFHIVPNDKVTKYDLLCLFRNHIGNKNIDIIPYEADLRVDRTLSTSLMEMNQMLWSSIGYATIPSIECLVGELAPDAPIKL